MKKDYIIVADVRVEVWWKAVKRVNLVVYAADGRVRISVPQATSLAFVQRTLFDRLDWIKEQQKKILNRAIPVPLQFTDGEQHSFLGKDYPLCVAQSGSRHFVSFESSAGITLHLCQGSTKQQRQRLLEKWYREQLNSRIPALLKHWQPLVGKDVCEFRIKKMKTRWGTCNINARRIWLNLELIKKEEKCLEYILVHEMVHLLETGHTYTFYAHLDRLLPDWRSRDILLK